MAILLKSAKGAISSLSRLMSASPKSSENNKHTKMDNKMSREVQRLDHWGREDDLQHTTVGGRPLRPRNSAAKNGKPSKQPPQPPSGPPNNPTTNKAAAKSHDSGNNRQKQSSGGQESNKAMDAPSVPPPPAMPDPSNSNPFEAFSRGQPTLEEQQPQQRPTNKTQQNVGKDKQAKVPSANNKQPQPVLDRRSITKDDLTRQKSLLKKTASKVQTEKHITTSTAARSPRHENPQATMSNRYETLEHFSPPHSDDDQIPNSEPMAHAPKIRSALAPIREEHTGDFSQIEVKPLNRVLSFAPNTDPKARNDNNVLEQQLQPAGQSKSTPNQFTAPTRTSTIKPATRIQTMSHSDNPCDPELPPSPYQDYWPSSIHERRLHQSNRLSSSPEIEYKPATSSNRRHRSPSPERRHYRSPSPHRSNRLADNQHKPERLENRERTPPDYRDLAPPGRYRRSISPEPDYLRSSSQHTRIRESRSPTRRFYPTYYYSDDSIPKRKIRSHTTTQGSHSLSPDDSDDKNRHTSTMSQCSLDSSPHRPQGRTPIVQRDRDRYFEPQVPREQHNTNMRYKKVSLPTERDLHSPPRHQSRLHQPSARHEASDSEHELRTNPHRHRRPRQDHDVFNGPRWMQREGQPHPHAEYEQDETEDDRGTRSRPRKVVAKVHDASAPKQSQWNKNGERPRRSHKLAPKTRKGGNHDPDPGDSGSDPSSDNDEPNEPRKPNRKKRSSRSSGSGHDDRAEKGHKQPNKDPHNDPGDSSPGDSDPNDSNSGSASSRSSKKNDKHKKRNETIKQNITMFHGRIPELVKFTNTYLDKTNFTEFIEQFDLHTLGMGVPTEMLGRLLPLYFTDSALLIYKKVIDEHPEIATDYPLLVSKLHEKFNKKSGIPADELSNIVKHPDQTTSAFYNKVKTLAAQVYPNMNKEGLDDVIKTHFIGGLDYETRLHFSNKGRPVTSYEAYLEAESRENTRKRLKPAKRGHVMALTEQEQQTMYVQQTLAQEDLNNRELMAQRPRQADNRQPQNYNGQNRDSRSNNNQNQANYRPGNNPRYGWPDQNNRAGNRQQPYPPRGPQQNQNQQYRQPYNQNDQYQRNRQQNWQPNNRNNQGRGNNNQRNNQPNRREEQIRNRNDRPWRNQFTTDGKPICNYCGGKNHMEYACFHKRRDMQQNHIAPAPEPTQNTNNTTPADTRVQYEDDFELGFVYNVLPFKSGSQVKTVHTGKDVCTCKRGQRDEDLLKPFFLIFTWFMTLTTEVFFKGTQAINKVRIVPQWIMTLIVFLFLVDSITCMNSKPMVCPKSHREGSKSHLLLSLPKAQQCPNYESKTKSAVQPLNLQFYHTRAITKQDQGYLCYKRITTIKTFLYMLEEERLHKSFERLETVDANTCWDMINNQEIDGHKLVVQNGVISTHRDTSPRYTWCCRWVKSEVVNYFVEIGYLYLDRTTGYIKTSLGNTHNCKYTDGQCEIDSHGMIVWIVEQEQQCQYEKWDFIQGEYHAKHWISQSREFALTFTKYSDTTFVICNGEGGNVTVWKSDQGALVEPDKAINDSYLPPIVHPIVAHVNSTLHPHVQQARQMINIIVQSVSDTIQQEDAKVFWQGIQALCQHNRLAVNLFSHLVRLSPTLITRDLLNDQYITAQYTGGDLITVQSCLPVTNYNFTRHPEAKCSDRIPLNYSLQDKEMNGYMDPKTNIIFTDSLAHHCTPHETILFSIDQVAFEYRWATGNVTQLPNSSNILTQRLTQNFTYHQSPLVIYRENSGLIPIAEAGSDESFLNDFIQTIAAEREILRTYGNNDDLEDSNAVVVSGESSGILAWIEKSWEKILKWWSFAVNVLVTLVVLSIIVQTFRRMGASRQSNHRQRRARAADIESQNEHDNEVSVIEGFEVLPINTVKSSEQPSDNPEFLRDLSEANNPYMVPLTKIKLSKPGSNDNNAVQYTAMIDTGSYFNILGPSAASQLNLDVKPTTITPYSYNGSAIELVGETSCVVQLLGKTFTLRFLIAKEAPVREVLVGFRCFWNLDKVEFRPKEGVIVVEGKHFPLIAPRHSSRICTIANIYEDTGPLTPEDELSEGLMHNLHPPACYSDYWQ